MKRIVVPRNYYSLWRGNVPVVLDAETLEFRRLGSPEQEIGSDEKTIGSRQYVEHLYWTMHRTKCVLLTPNRRPFKWLSYSPLFPPLPPEAKPKPEVVKTEIGNLEWREPIECFCRSYVWVDKLGRPHAPPDPPVHHPTCVFHSVVRSKPNPPDDASPPTTPNNEAEL